MNSYEVLESVSFHIRNAIFLEDKESANADAEERDFNTIKI
jgi:hypothetical protein